MLQKHIVISMIAPVTVAGILIMAILANQAFAYSSSNYSYKSYKGHGNNYKTSKYTKHGNTAQGASNGNTAQGASNTGQGGASGQTTMGTVAQGGTSSQAGHCKPAVALSAQWLPPVPKLYDKGHTNVWWLRTKWKNHNIDKQQALVCRNIRNRSNRRRRFIFQIL